MQKCEYCKADLIIHKIRSRTREYIYAHCSNCNTPSWLKVPPHIPDEQTMRYLNAKV